MVLPIEVELARAQRYFEAGRVKGWGVASSGQAVGETYFFVTAKRSSPTIGLGTPALVSLPSIAVESTGIGSFNIVGICNTTGGYVYNVDQWTADSEL